MRGPLVRLATPLKAWTQRFAFVLLVGAAFALTLMGRSDTPVVSELRTAVTDLVAPFLDVASRPVATTADVIHSVESLAELRAENAALRRENERLQHWRAVAHELRADNAALQRMLKVPNAPDTQYVTARVIGDSGGAFVRSVLVNAGQQHGVTVGQAALAPDGLAGRVVEVGRNSARVLLITDINSRIPVVIQRTRVRAVLAGDNTERPKLTYLADQAEVAPGQRVVTSGDGGVFPPGVPVGKVVETPESGVRVQPFVDWHRMEYLRVADHAQADALMTDAAPSAEAAVAQGTPR
ncbi:rod shape-determining protein MreC [Limimonas halophila]|uniref:Cell shape-determining protein MreC n=1 Tax=Limimonas halophila TaxID=1082479 RepID=A0A1G7L187_9PROT|nr:rod shape-determining protein MreC [Limimonas halophila]SDF43213.1 rod shape-determining protein MreC [Limimonas halophila]